MKYALLPILLAMVLVGCGPTTVTSLLDHGGKQWSAQEVHDKLRGNTLKAKSFKDDTLFYFTPSGKLFVQAMHVPQQDHGKWDISQDGELCLRVKKWWYGDLRCFQVIETPDNRIHLASTGGVLTYSALLEPGDSHHLYQADHSKKNHARRSYLTHKKDSQPSLSLPKERASAGQEEQTGAEYGRQDTALTLEWTAKDCPGCNLAGADLGKADLIEAKLAGADLQGANLTMANLRRANLQGADLRGAILAYANLPGADLRQANLEGAVLKGANLIKADLTGARLQDTDLRETLQEGAKGLDAQSTE